MGKGLLRRPDSSSSDPLAHPRPSELGSQGVPDTRVHDTAALEVKHANGVAGRCREGELPHSIQPKTSLTRLRLFRLSEGRVVRVVQGSRVRAPTRRRNHS